MSSITYNNDVNINTGYKLSSSGEIIVSNRISSLGYQLNSTSTGNPISTSLKSVNNRIKTSRGTVVKSIISTWTARNPPNNNISVIAWSSELSLFVACPAGPSNFYYSYDGINWVDTGVTNPFLPYSYVGVIWSAELSLFIAVRDVQSASTTVNIRTSPDGINWTYQTTPSIRGCTDICYSPELNVIVATSLDSGYKILYYNGTSWSSGSISGKTFACCWSSDLKLFVALGDNVMYSSINGINWTTGNSINLSLNNTTSYDAVGIAWSSELYTFIVTGYYLGDSYIYKSSDGITWTQSYTTSEQLSKCLWINELSIFVIPSNDNNNNISIYYSHDAINWNKYTISGTINQASGICWSPELSIIVIPQTNDNIYTSTPVLPTNLNTIKGPSSQIYLNPSNGQLGINQSSPSYLLDVNGTSRFTGIISLTSNTTSTSSSTGALKITGGIGISNTTDASSSTNGGSLTSAGGLAIAKKLYVGTDLNVSGTINASAITASGSLLLTGTPDNLTIRPSSGFGSTIVLDAATNLSGKSYRIFSSGTTAGELPNKLIFQNATDNTFPLELTSTGNMMGYSGSATTSYQLDVNGTSRFTGIMSLSSNTSSSSTSTGTLVVTGGLGLSGNINSGGSITTGTAIQNSGGWSIIPTSDTVSYSSTVSSADKFNLSAWNNSGTNSAVYVGQGSSSFVGAVQDAAIIITTTAKPIILCPNNTVQMTVNSGGNVSMSGNIASTSTTSGTLVVTGGVGISGAVNIGGALAKGSGTFDIPHVLKNNDSERLIHSFIEGPRVDLIYRGNIQLINGIAEVNIDKDCVESLDCSMTEGTFVALTKNPVYYLQNNTSFDRIIGKIINNILTITCENTFSNDIINWMVIAERNDPFIKKWDKTNSSGNLITEYTQ